MTQVIIKKKKKTDDLYLAHHGVKGMKWGVRRYQNADGTLTDKGKKRFASEKAYQGKMNIKQTERYAKERIKNRGARQAIEDEKETYRKSIMRPIGVGASTGVATGATVGGITGGPAGALLGAYAGGVMGTAVSAIGSSVASVKRGQQFVRNIDTLKRISDIPDVTTGIRYNTR